jgi:hypothetical protein
MAVMAVAFVFMGCRGKTMVGAASRTGFRAHLERRALAAPVERCGNPVTVEPTELRVSSETGVFVDAPRLRRQGERLLLTGRIVVALTPQAGMGRTVAESHGPALLAVLFETDGTAQFVPFPDADVALQDAAIARLHPDGTLSAFWVPVTSPGSRWTPAILGARWNGSRWIRQDSVVRPSHAARLDFPDVFDASEASATEQSVVVRWFESGSGNAALVRTDESGWVLSSMDLPFSPRFSFVARDASHMLAVGIKPATGANATIAAWRSSDGGQSWDRPVPIEASVVENVQAPSVLRVGQDVFVAAWPAGMGSSVREIHAAVSRDGGASWRAVRPIRLEHEIWAIDMTSDSNGRVALVASTAAFGGLQSLRPEVLVLSHDAAYWQSVWKAPLTAPAAAGATIATDSNDELVVLYARSPDGSPSPPPAYAVVLPAICEDTSS